MTIFDCHYTSITEIRGGLNPEIVTHTSGVQCKFGLRMDDVSGQFIA